MNRRRRTIPLVLAEVGRIPAPCRTCVFWELDDAAGVAVRRSGDGGLEKEAWLSGVLLDNPAAGRLALVDSETAGYVVWAPPAQVPRAGAFPTSPVSADAVLLTALYVVGAHRGVGVGRSLVRAAVGELSRSGIEAVEAFGWAGAASAPCLVPADFLTAVGFRVVAPHPLRPRLRLDVSTALPTHAEAEARLDRLRGVFRPLPRRRRAAAGVPAPAPVPVRAGNGWSRLLGRTQPASSDSRIIPVGASASAGR